MEAAGKIKVLVVDNSFLFRETLARGLSRDPEIEVVAKARDPFDARDKILQYNPDVLTCDVVMPKMSGIEFIRQLLPQQPLPVIVVSTVSDAVLDALNAGAVDFVVKPESITVATVEEFARDLAQKVKIAARARVPLSRHPVQAASFPEKGLKLDTEKIIAMGASTGGTEALNKILKELPPVMPGIVIVQHIPPVFSRLFAERLNSQLPLSVKEAEDGDLVEPGRVLIAPGNFHMRVARAGGKQLKVEVFSGPKVNGHCPSVDVLFESVAAVAGERAIGVILTGMGADGAKGLLAIRQSGGRTLGQDEESCVVYGMPKAAFELGAVEKQLPLSHIAKDLIALAQKN